MESKKDSANSAAFMSEKRNGSSSTVDQKKVSNTDGSTTLIESKRHCPDSRGRKPVSDGDGSSATVLRPDTKNNSSSKAVVADDFSHYVVKPTSQVSVSPALSTKRHGKGIVTDERRDDIMFFADVTPGPHEAVLRFRLIHFWEARNPHTKLLIGEEMLLIDEKGTAIQGFIPPGRIDAHLPHLKAGSVYKLRNFFGSKSKENYRVADHNVTVTFSWNSVLTLIKDDPVPFLEDRFRFHSHDEFKANCDRKGDLYDYVGHMRLVEGQTIADCPKLGEVDIAAKRHVLVHVQTHDGPLMKMYLWDKAAADFCQKFKSSGSTLGVLMVTTVNPKRLGGTLALASMPSSRVFMDTDVHATREYLSWLSSNLDIANRVSAEVMTKPECVTISELFGYIKQETAKVAWFECTATIDDVFRGSAWYYISCGECHTKATKGANSLMCTNNKCKKSKVTGVPEYIVKVSVYDKSEQAVFVILGDAGRDLTGKHASQLVADYFENNESVGAADVVPVPQALLETIGQTRRFIVKISDHNLTGKTQSITVTKVLPPQQPQHCIEDAAGENMGEVPGSHSSEEVISG